MIKGMAPGIKKSCCGSSGKDGMSKGENIRPGKMLSRMQDIVKL